MCRGLPARAGSEGLRGRRIQTQIVGGYYINVRHQPHIQRWALRAAGRTVVNFQRLAHNLKLGLDASLRWKAFSLSFRKTSGGAMKRRHHVSPEVLVHRKTRACKWNRAILDGAHGRMNVSPGTRISSASLNSSRPERNQRALLVG